MFNHKIFFCFSYSKNIRMKIISFKKTCTKTFIASSCRISKLNLTKSVNKIRKTAIINIITQMNNSNQCCWLSHIIILVLHFSNSSCLLVLYLNIHWQPSIWCSLNFWRSTAVQELKFCLCCLICCFMEFQKSFLYKWFLKSL